MKKILVLSLALFATQLAFAIQPSKTYVEEDNEDFYFDITGRINLRQPSIGYEEKNKRNYESAFKAFMRGAELGDLDSNYQIGNAYRLGNGVAKNLKQAHLWTLKAATRGHVSAQMQIGDDYQDGAGVEKDLIMSLAWYEIATQTKTSMEIYTQMAVKSSGLLQKQLSDKDIFRAKTIARKCMITNYVQCF